MIEELALDTCGFSRGAATARFAICRALEGEEDGPASLKARLEGLGYEVQQVKVLAVGLFDTVASYKLRHSRNVQQLKLDAIAHAKAVLQLAAAEEYRSNFSLTNIESAKDKGGRQVYLPGAHSDVGGCYEDFMTEEKDLYAGRASEDVAAFLLERGWYTRSQLALAHVGMHAIVAGARIRVKRSHISKEYSYIPLQLMAEFLVDQGLSFSDKLEKTFRLRTAKNDPNDPREPAPIPAALVDEIRRYAKTVSESKPTDWETPRDDLNLLRNHYLHVPYGTGTGMGVNLAKSGPFRARRYRPHRKVYRG